MQIGRYVLDRLIGDGGEAQVWRAYSVEHRNWSCALKLRPAVQLTERSDVEKQNAAFVNENSHWIEFTQSSIYIVNILDIISEIFEDEDGVKWVIRAIASEFSELGDLHKAIEEGRLHSYIKEEIRFIDFLRKIISGVGAGHRVQRIHCDIKPKNILLFRDGNTIAPKLTDFGVSRGVLEPVQGFTPGYAAPELAPGRAPTPESDVYSLGITFYQIFYSTIFSASPPTTASEFKSGRDYKRYLSTDFDIGSTQIEFDAVPYLKLMSSMTDENPKERPTLDQIDSILSASLTAVLRKVPSYSVQTERDHYHWNPAVHEILQEDLYYILVKGGNPVIELEDMLTDLDRTGFTGFSVRTVSGQWDYVVRIWIPKGDGNVKTVCAAIERNGRRATALEVISSELHHQPPRNFYRQRPEVEMIRDIESHAGDAANAALKRAGYTIGILNKSDFLFRVTLLVTIVPEYHQLAPVVGGMIKKTIQTYDGKAKDISYYDVKPVGNGSNIRLVIKFMHSSFVQCRATLLEVFRSLIGHQNRFSFSTLFDLNAPDDRMSDDGSIINQIINAHSSGRR